jgi:hypothetical protein
MVAGGADAWGKGAHHDGSAATLDDVVAHYDTELTLSLTVDERADLVQYLLSL